MKYLFKCSCLALLVNWNSLLSRRFYLIFIEPAININESNRLKAFWPSDVKPSPKWLHSPRIKLSDLEINSYQLENEISIVLEAHDAQKKSWRFKSRSTYLILYFGEGAMGSCWKWEAFDKAISGEMLKRMENFMAAKLFSHSSLLLFFRRLLILSPFLLPLLMYFLCVAHFALLSAECSTSVRKITDAE